MPKNKLTQRVIEILEEFKPRSPYEMNLEAVATQITKELKQESLNQYGLGQQEGIEFGKHKVKQEVKKMIEKKFHRDRECGTPKNPSCGVNVTLKDILENL